MTNEHSIDPPSDPVHAALDLRRGPAAYELLESVVERGRNGGLVVFDLDSTLLDNKIRQAQIMAEYGRAHAVPALAQVQAEHWQDWDYRAAMRRAGLAADEVEPHVEPYREYWRSRFFTSEYCRIDDAVRGAVDYVRAIRQAGARVFYVTGRHEQMREGSVASFERLGFPIPDVAAGIELWMKPSLDEHDDDFKARVHADLRERGAPAAVFDNEPAHVNDYLRSFPQAQVVHLATDHSMRPILVSPGIPSIKDFRDHRDRS